MRGKWKRWWGAAVLLGLGAVCVFADAPTIAERRARVREAAAQGNKGVAVLITALDDENALVRRTAVRALSGLAEQIPDAHDALAVALDSDDPVVQRTALLALVGEPAPESVPVLARALRSSDPWVRETAVHLLLAIEPLEDAAAELLRLAAADEAPEVQRPAAAALRPFRVAPRETVLLDDRPEMVDHVGRIRVLDSFPLTEKCWRFRFDEGGIGHTESWPAPDYDDAGWDKTNIGTHWRTGYIGVGWYRVEIELPERPVHLAAELHFEGVDETAWVWVNGIYVGGQDIGPGGWNRPFRLDVTDELQWGASNRIAVRVMNTTGGGGIWKPVTLEIRGFRPRR